jgi:hypothetical protein
MSRATAVLLLLLAAAPLPSCRDDAKRSSEPDWSSMTSVFETVMEAVSKEDLKTVWLYMTPEGREAAERDLRVWQLMLRDPETGARVLAEVRRLLGEDRVSTEEFVRARDGTIEETWRFFLRAKPRPAKPKMGGVRVQPDGRTAEILYQDVHGDWRPVTMVLRKDGRWLVERLQF